MAPPSDESGRERRAPVDREIGENPTSELRFRWPWRAYQARVLDVVDRHLDDDRLHIVAAPGAGKTTLGLEVFRRLATPALVLAPTLTIRNQWIRRLEDFLPEPSPGSGAWRAPDWVSSDLRSPAFFTVATYQAVVTKSRSEREDSEEPEDAPAPTDSTPSRADEQSLVGLLRAAEVETLILDEAHHLKRAWWRSLDRVVEELGGLRLVSLTGTPPYDATGHEWRRYEALCGPIDEEISVPELVRARTLCPHQDYIHAVAPLDEEERTVRAHAAAVEEVLTELVDDPRFQSWVDAHPWLGSDPPIEAVLDEPALAVSLLAFQQVTAAGTSSELLRVLDLEGGDVPPLDRERWELLLGDFLFGENESDPDTRAEVARTLRAKDLLWRRSLRLAATPAAERALAASGAKVRGCVEINEIERAVRGDGLRQVYLLDFIRDGALRDPPGVGRPELGAFPVFDALRDEDVAMLTGRLTCLHASKLDALVDALRGESVTTTGLPYREGWRVVTGIPTGALVAAFTRLLSDGALRVLVGTRALLGEGWDAPVVNSVVLASYVGAFVSTNQMRGRGIRADPDRKNKVASVWHLVALLHETPTGFVDLERLEERFRTFVGLSHDGSVIESGLDRLRLPPLETSADLGPFNEEFRLRLPRLHLVALAWHDAIEGSEVGQVVPTVSFRRPPTLRPYQITHTLRYVLLEVGWASLFAAGAALQNVIGRGGTAMMVGAAVPLVLLAPKLVRAGRLALAHAPVDGSVRHIARAVLDALRVAELLEGDSAGVRVSREPDGAVQVSLDGGSFRDQSMFVDAVGEVLGPVENPRYLITRPFSGLGGDRVDYHAVPTVLGAKREFADAFLEAWRRRVGAGELIFTRREGGRAALLAARGRAFANRFVDPAERIDRWR